MDELEGTYKCSASDSLRRSSLDHRRSTPESLRCLGSSTDSPRCFSFVAGQEKRRNEAPNFHVEKICFIFLLVVVGGRAGWSCGSSKKAGDPTPSGPLTVVTEGPSS